MPLESCGEVLESTHINVNTLQGGEPFFLTLGSAGRYITT